MDLYRKITAASLGAITGTGSAGQVAFFSAASTIAGSSNLTWDNVKNLFTVNGRILGAKGANVTAANDMTLGNDGNFFYVNGNTQINGIANTDWTLGSYVTLVFSGTPTVKHNTAAGIGFSSLLLAGGVDFATTANDLLYLIQDGTYWREVSRTVL